MQRLISRILLIVAAAAILFLWGLPKILPATQLDRAEADLFRSLERANRSLLEKRLADDYRDQWDQDRAIALERSMDLARQFLVVEIQRERGTAEINGTRATTRARIRIEGRGTAAAPIISQRVNRIETPFLMEWRRQPWKPWSWQLTTVSNPTLLRLE